MMVWIEQMRDGNCSSGKFAAFDTESWPMHTHRANYCQGSETRFGVRAASLSTNLLPGQIARIFMSVLDPRRFSFGACGLVAGRIHRV